MMRETAGEGGRSALQGPESSLQSWPWAQAALLGLAGYVPAVCVLVGILGFTDVAYGFFDLTDIGLYHQWASAVDRGLRPYVDFPFEYPPLAMAAIAFPGHPVEIWPYARAFAALMLTTLAVSSVLVARTGSAIWPGWRRPMVVAGTFGASVIAIGAIVANRYDATIALSVALFAWALVSGRWGIAGISLGLGTALKLTPIILLPVGLVLPRALRDRAGMLAGFAVAAILPMLARSPEAWGGMSSVLRYHGERPLQLESVLAMPLLLGQAAGWVPVRVIDAYGSQGIEGPGATLLAGASPALLGGGLLGVIGFLAIRRRALRSDPTLLPGAILAVLLVFLVTSKVLSPQYMVWLLPAIALVAPVDRILAGLLLGALVLTQVEFPAMYWDLARLRAVPIVVVSIRNGLLVASLGRSIALIARRNEKHSLEGESPA